MIPGHSIETLSARLEATGTRRSGSERCTNGARIARCVKKSLIYGPSLVAPTGIEPANWGPGRSRLVPKSPPVRVLTLSSPGQSRLIPASFT
jgi:hypothetical protein